MSIASAAVSLIVLPTIEFLSLRSGSQRDTWHQLLCALPT